MAYHQPEYLFSGTSFVEVMAPYFSRVALLRSMETFPQSISTYGLDLVWPSLVGGSSIGVIDAFQIRHKEQVDHKSGSFYRYLSSIGVDLNEDEERMLSQYRVSLSCAHSLRGYFRDQSNSPIDAQLSLKSVALLGIERFTSSQAVIDLAMRTARRGPSRQETDLGQQLACLGVRRILPATS